MRGWCADVVLGVRGSQIYVKVLHTLGDRTCSGDSARGHSSAVSAAIWMPLECPASTTGSRCYVHSQPAAARAYSATVSSCGRCRCRCRCLRAARSAAPRRGHPAGSRSSWPDRWVRSGAQGVKAGPWIITMAVRPGAAHPATGSACASALPHEPWCRPRRAWPVDFPGGEVRAGGGDGPQRVHPAGDRGEHRGSNRRGARPAGRCPTSTVRFTAAGDGRPAS
jgi:hypothetical protein